jgi:hypothetical protein
MTVPDPIRMDLKQHICQKLILQPNTFPYPKPSESHPHLSYFFKIHFNVNHSSLLRTSKWSVSFRFYTEVLLLPFEQASVGSEQETRFLLA